MADELLKSVQDVKTQREKEGNRKNRDDRQIAKQ